MSSILTNNAAMTALQTLKGINNNLEMTQSQISTGKKVGSASDNAATWAISKTIEADVTGFSKISEGLDKGSKTVAVAQNAAETTTDLLQDIKGKIVQAQNADNDSDRAKLQDDIDSFVEQVKSVVGAAQLNGENLVNGKSDEAMDVLSSLDRASDGSVTASNISVERNDLTQDVTTVGTLNADAAAGAAVNSGASGLAATFTGSVSAGQSYQFSSGGGLGLSEAVSYVASEGDTLSDVTSSMVNQLNAQAQEDGIDVSFSTTSTDGEIQLQNDTDAAITVAANEAEQDDGTALDGIAGGGLETLSKIDVSDENASAASLTRVEGLIQTSIDAAASFGTAQNQIETQANFVSKLTDSMEAGMGALVDANMEEASARLTALQTQQQLATQSLSIANQGPQNILALFRG